MTLQTYIVCGRRRDDQSRNPSGIVNIIVDTEFGEEFRKARLIAGDAYDFGWCSREIKKPMPDNYKNILFSNTEMYDRFGARCWLTLPR